MTINEILSFVSPILAIATFFIGRKTASRNDGKQDGIMLTEIGYLKKGNDDILRKIEAQEHQYSELAVRVAHLEESAKRSQLRLDMIEKRGNV